MFLEFPVELQLILQPYDRPPGLWFSVATWPAGQMKSCDLRYSTPGRRKGGRETENRVKEGSAKNLYQSNVILLIKHWTTACEIQIGHKECHFICEAMCSELKPFVHAAQCGTEIILRKWLFLDWYCLWASPPTLSLMFSIEICGFFFPETHSSPVSLTTSRTEKEITTLGARAAPLLPGRSARVCVA